MSERVRDDVVFRDEAGAIRLIRLVVHGKPISQGSKRHVGHGVMVESAKGLAAWRHQVQSVAHYAHAGTLAGPLNISLSFRFAYRKGDLTKMGVPKATAPDYHTTYPDLDKLARAVLDALAAAGIMGNDSQVAVLVCEKRYAPTSGVKIEIRPL